MDDYVLIDGTKYYPCKKVADLWHVTPRSVSKYCKQGKTKLCQLVKGKWFISEKEIKPLNIREIQYILIMTLMLKNDPSCRIDFSLVNVDSNSIRYVFEWLFRHNYVFEFEIDDDNRIPYDVIITEKGLNCAFSQTNSDSDCSVKKMINKGIPTILSISQLVVGILAIR